jgi:hypothetical protein
VDSLSVRSSLSFLPGARFAKFALGRETRNGGPKMYTRANSEKECCSKSSFRPRGNGPIGHINLRLPGFVAVLVLTSAIVGVIAAASAAGAADVTPFTVAIPTVTGPIPSTSTNFPYIADGFDVEPPVPPGYVEQEYFFSGTGNLYEYTPTGIEVVTPCPASVTEGTNCTDIPYTTRMLVKRPIDPHKFSGTVIIEALNPSANFDIAAIWDRSLNYFVRDGDVFVGWTSKSVTVNTLKTWNPARYAPLEWTYAPFTPGSNNGVYDGITFDIAAQIGALFKQNGASSPLNGLNVTHVYEAGFSQDGSFTFTQADIFNALERLADGSPVYHGYVPGGQRPERSQLRTHCCGCAAARRSPRPNAAA